MSDTSIKFDINQRVVYPSQGVGIIKDIKERPFKDKTLTYYVIYLEVSDMTVMIPVERSEDLGLRPVVTKEEAEAALEMMGQEFEPVTSDWKLRYQMNLELQKKGTITDIASIVRCLYHRSKVKELPILERKLYDSAKKLLEDEIALAIDKSPKEVEGIIHSKLEPLGIIRNEKSSVSDDEDYDDDEEFLDDDNNEEEESDDEDGDDED